MGKTKFAFARYRIINRELRRKSWVKTSELETIIEEALGKKITSRQLEKDMEDMKSDILLGFEAPIVYDQGKKAYKYTDRSFTIEKFHLHDEELTALKFYAATLNQYRDSGIFKDFSSALDKVVQAVSIKTSISKTADAHLIVQTDNVSVKKGNEFLIEIARAIEARRKVKFNYKKFTSDKAKERIVAPYLLKEYRNRWYLIGLEDGKLSVATFGLDRMSGLKSLPESYNENIGFNHNTFFKHSFGISKPELPPEKIILHFSVDQGHYVKTLPIHSSQKVISDSNKGLRISIEVGRSFELLEYLIGNADRVKVISPQSLLNQIKKAHRDSLKAYSK